MLKKSNLLGYILNNAEKMKDADGKKSISANYFFAALLRLMQEERDNRLPAGIDNDETAQELEQVEALIKNYDLDYAEASEALLRAMQDESYNAAIDEFVFGKMNFSAEYQAKRMEKTVIDVHVYVTMILNEPTTALKRILSKAEGRKEQAPAADRSEGEAEANELTTALEALMEEFARKADAVLSENAEAEKEEPQAPPAGRIRVWKGKKGAAGKAAEEKTEDAAPDASYLADTVTDTGRIRKILLDNVFGQDQAVNAFVSGFFRSEMTAKARSGGGKPRATFLFAGPPGVGKTFLAETAAAAIGLPFKCFDMSEYVNKEADVEFAGSDSVYKNGKAGNVTSYVASHPRSVLLFDEIEKAHYSVIHLFLQILDAGRLRDNYTDKVISFADTVIIFTTNAGKNLYDETSVMNLSSLSQKKIMKALSTDLRPESKEPLFPPAICSRFASGNVVMFNRLGVNHLFSIARRELEKGASDFERITGIKVQMDPKTTTALIFAEGGKADARTVKGRAASFFHAEIYELFRLLNAKPDVIKKIGTIKVDVSLDDCAPELAQMFVNPKKPEVLVFRSKDGTEDALLGMESVICHMTDDIETAKDILFDHDISIILCDVLCRPQNPDKKLLNIEDVISEGRSFLQCALSQFDIPVYLFQEEKDKLSREEFLSFAEAGVQGIVSIGDKPSSTEKEIAERCEIAYQQVNMLKLSRESKIVSYKTAQSLSRNKKTAEIALFDFKMTLSPDMDDEKHILDRVSRPNIHFSDVIGAEDAKKELTYFVRYLKEPVKYMRQGLRAPKGVLLYGPPGTGKTMLAKAMAGESDVTFMAAEGNQFIKDGYNGADTVHKLFASARKYAPTILFIDEIDAIGQNRGGGVGSLTGDILTAFLTEMDGFRTDTKKPIFVLAATNFSVEQGTARSLDPALLRRFDRRIYVDLPTKDERKLFLEKKAGSGKMVSLSEAQIENIAVRSTGMSLAELDSVYDMALRNAVGTNGLVDDAAFENAFETFTGGEAKKWSSDTLLRTARHEAGHTLLSWLGGDKPSYVTVVSRGDHGGYMQQGDEEKGIYTKEELLGHIRTSLAGRAAEMVCYGERDGVSTGAAGDLRHATHMAEQLIGKYGMDETVGLSYIEDNDRFSPYYTEVRRRVNDILATELRYVIDVISENREAIDKMTAALIEKNHLKADEIDGLLSSMCRKPE